MDPNLYLSRSQSDVYTEVAVYVDEETGQERAVDWKSSGSLLTGCGCRNRGESCSMKEECECNTDQQPGPGGICTSTKCPVCARTPTRCTIYPVCECRKNATDDEVAVCNELCHGNRGAGCAHKYKLSPREDSLAIVQHGEMGLGVRTTKTIGQGWSIGTYAGVLKTALELYETANAIEVGRPGSLGLSAYMNIALDRPRPLSNAEPATLAWALPHGTYTVDNVLAAHTINGQRHILVNWEGHKSPTWQLDTGDIAHTYTCANLREYKDDDPQCQREIGPAAYTLFTGILHGFSCCAHCRDPAKHKDGWDFRLYIDASHKGNLTRFINHSCEPNCRVVPARLGSHMYALVVPLIVSDKEIKKGVFVTFAYWHLEDLTNVQRRKLRQQTSGRPDECKCGSKLCTGWISLPPRDALLAAGVSAQKVADLWLDDEYAKPDVTAL